MIRTHCADADLVDPCSPRHTSELAHAKSIAFTRQPVTLVEAVLVDDAQGELRVPGPARAAHGDVQQEADSVRGVDADHVEEAARPARSALASQRLAERGSAVRVDLARELWVRGVGEVLELDRHAVAAGCELGRHGDDRLDHHPALEAPDVRRVTAVHVLGEVAFFGSSVEVDGVTTADFDARAVTLEACVHVAGARRVTARRQEGESQPSRQALRHAARSTKGEEEGHQQSRP